MSSHDAQSLQKEPMDTLTHPEAPALPQTLTDLYLAHAATAKKVARREHRKMPSCTVEDMEQAIWEHATKKTKHYVGKDASTVESYMTKAAKQFWSRERTDYMYFTGSYMYTPADVRRILAASAWSRLDECPDVEGRIDVRAAYMTLAPMQRRAVYKLYGLKEEQANFTESEGRNLRYGIDNITHRLNSGLDKRPTDFNTLGETV